MNDYVNRTTVSIVGGLGGGLLLWLSHGVSKILGLPRLLVYSTAVGAAIYVVDYLTETLPAAPARWSGRPDEGP